MIKGIIFDFDMTLVDTLEIGHKIFCEMERKYGLNVFSLSERKVWGESRKNFLSAVWRANKHKIPLEKINKIHLAVMDKFYKNCRLKDIEVLKFFQNHKIKLGIISNNSNRIVKKVLRMPVNRVIKFDAVLSAEKSTDNVSKVSLIKKCLRRLNLKKSEAIYVGDHIMDIIAAERVDVISAGIPTGLYSKKELKKHHPDLLINNFRDLKKYILVNNII
ncbi:MAG: HAD hydrolase-like protein [Patescibacteria group bacterium]|nr:HAD hydrolase-like protein [Patescibacteria group bacterium]MDD5121583.1 HAD hydrolase-like protein [Patescibacteria group bacterium]MDD5222293.1 HAD hydrolase-like protein [Patescibacteria group bacterium]MDD5396253.1 HAD hydrolase-like protein [Patescibacteria group bacterium]